MAVSRNEFSTALRRLRKRIDRLDGRLMRLLLHRARAVERVGILKNKNAVPVADREREQEILERIEKIGTGSGKRDFLRRIYGCIFQASREIEEGEGSEYGSGSAGNEIDQGRDRGPGR
jgi:chorismate mutase